MWNPLDSKDGDTTIVLDVKEQGGILFYCTTGESVTGCGWRPAPEVSEWLIARFWLVQSFSCGSNEHLRPSAYTKGPEADWNALCRRPTQDDEKLLDAMKSMVIKDEQELPTEGQALNGDALVLAMGEMEVDHPDDWEWETVWSLHDKEPPSNGGMKDDS